MRSYFSTMAGVAAIAVCLPTAALHAQDAAEYYKGKQLQLYVGVSPGGIYSTFALILSHHFGKYIPGHPSVVVQHMQGAGGTKMLNYVYNVAPQDGSVVTAPNAGVALRVLLKIGKPKYDPAKFQWLGGWGDAINTITLRKDAPAHTLKDAMKTQIVLGSIGKSSNTFMIPSLMNNTIGTKFKLITGYRGGSPIRAAIERGEVHGWAGQWLGWKLAKPDWVRDGKLVHLVQMARKRAADLPNVPLLSEFATNDEQREFFGIVQSGIADRAFVAAPKVPRSLTGALAQAYMKTIGDPAFIAETGKRSYVIEPIEGSEIQAFVEKMMTMPDAKVERLRTLMGLKN